MTIVIISWCWFFGIIRLLPTVLVVPRCTDAGIIPHNINLSSRKSNYFLQYDDGYIRAPGIIDLSGLIFTTGSMVATASYSKPSNDVEPSQSNNNNKINNYSQSDKNTYNNGDNNSLQLQRNLGEWMDHSSSSRGNVNYNETTITTTATTTTRVDIAIFHVPEDCSASEHGCDWSSLGVGKRNDAGKVVWCCSREASRLGLCPKKNYKNKTDSTSTGLIIDYTQFRGIVRSVDVSTTQNTRLTTSDAVVVEKRSGTYIVLYSNCNENGKEIHITGQSIWKSIHGYLPGELFGFMMFYRIVAFMYLLLCIYFGTMMRHYKESRIEIEKWIQISIGMGLVEMLFRSGDYMMWNCTGFRSSIFIWIGILLGALKQGIARCLLIMVSMGWGVTRDTLGNSMSSIVLFGGTSIGTIAVIDSMVVFANQHDNMLWNSVEDGIVGIVTLLTSLKVMLDVLFMIWVLQSLRMTINHLTKINQHQKLTRICHLRNVFVVSVLCNTFWFLHSCSHTHMEGGIHEKAHAWANDLSSEVNFLFVLIGVAILWHPNEYARLYVYTTDLPLPGTTRKRSDLMTGTSSYLNKTQV